MAAGAGRSSREVAIAGLRVGRGKKAWPRAQLCAFFDQLATGANVRTAAAAARVDPASAYRRRAIDADFRAIWEGAILEGIAQRAIDAIASALDPVGADEEDDTEQGATDLTTALKLIVWHDARDKRHGRGVQVACMPIDQVEGILMRRLAAVERRLTKTAAAEIAEPLRLEEPPGRQQLAGPAPRIGEL